MHRQAMQATMVFPSIEQPMERPFESKLKTPTSKYNAHEGRPKRKTLQDEPDTNREPGCKPTRAARLVKREPSTNVTPGIASYVPGLASPPLWNTNVRSMKLEEEGFVELPKEVVEYELTKKWLSVQKKFLRAQQRQEKGKAPERDMRLATKILKKEGCGQAAKGVGKRSKMRKISMNKPHSGEPHMKSASDKTQSPVAKGQANNQDTQIKAENGLQVQSTNCGNIHENSFTSNGWKHDREKGTRALRMDQAEGARRHNAPTTPGPRRENCTCEMLPECLTKFWYSIPRRAPESLSKLEFLEHVRQMSSCRGHPERVIRRCLDILRLENYPDKLGNDLAMDFARGLPLPNTSPSRGQTQSSLMTPEFNTNPLDCRPPPSENEFPKVYQCDNAGSMPLTTSKSFSSIVPYARLNSKPFKPLAAKSTSRSMIGKQTNDPTPPQQSSLLEGRQKSVPGMQPFKNATRQNHRIEKGSANTTREQRILSGCQSSPKRDRAMSKRHKSMPAFTDRRKADTADNISGQQRQLSVLRPLIPDTAIPGDKCDDITERLERIESMLSTAAPDRIVASENAISAPPAEINPQSSQPPKKKRKPAAERKAADQPVIPRDVPHHLRLPDSMLIEIGREICGYERHKRAPYAFSWHGRLWSEYDHLLTGVDEHNDRVWDYKTISRLKR